MPATPFITTLKIATILSLLLGAWLFWSPWEYGVAGQWNALNNWITGPLIMIAAAWRISSPRKRHWLVLLEMAIGVWIAASPWIFGYWNETARLANSVCAGVLLILFSLSSFREDDV